MRRIELVSLAVLVAVLAMPQAIPAYTNPFALNFTGSGDTAGWSDPVNTATPPTFTAGSAISADSPAYSPTPETAAGFNSTPWFRIGQAAGDNFGVALAIYDGTAGGSTTDPIDYTVICDVFVVVSPATQRNQCGIAARWTAADGNLPFEFFYSHNTPGQPNGYGYRGGGVAAAQYGLFPAETSNRWVRMKVVITGSTAEVHLDRELDGTYELSQTAIAIGSTAGKPGVFSVINDPTAGNVGVPNQYSYFDHFTYNQPSAVEDWQLY